MDAPKQEEYLEDYQNDESDASGYISEDEVAIVAPESGLLEEDKVEQLVATIEEVQKLKTLLKEKNDKNKAIVFDIKNDLKILEEDLVNLFIETKVPSASIQNFQYKVQETRKLNSFTRKSVREKCEELYGNEKGIKIFDEINAEIGEDEPVLKLKKTKMPKKKRRKKMKN